MSTQKSENISESAVIPNAGVVSDAGESKDLFSDDASDGSEMTVEQTTLPEELDELAEAAEAEVIEKVRSSEKNNSAMS